MRANATGESESKGTDNPIINKATLNDIVKKAYPDHNAWIHGTMSSCLVAASIRPWLTFFRIHQNLVPKHLHEELNKDYSEQTLSEWELAGMLRACGRLQEDGSYIDNDSGSKFAERSKEIAMGFMGDFEISDAQKAYLSHAIKGRIEEGRFINLLAYIVKHIITVHSLRDGTGKTFNLDSEERPPFPAWNRKKATDHDKKAFVDFLKTNINLVRETYTFFTGKLITDQETIAEPVAHETHHRSKVNRIQSVIQENANPDVYFRIDDHASRYFNTYFHKNTKKGQRVKLVKRYVRGGISEKEKVQLEQYRPCIDITHRLYKKQIIDQFQHHGISNFEENGMLEAALIDALLGEQYRTAYSAQESWSVIFSVVIKLLLQKQNQDPGVATKAMRLANGTCFRSKLTSAQNNYENYGQDTRSPDNDICSIAVAASISAYANVEYASANDLLNRGTWQSIVSQHIANQRFDILTGYVSSLSNWATHIQTAFCLEVIRIIDQAELPHFCLQSFYFDIDNDPLANQIAVVGRQGYVSSLDSPISASIAKMLKSEDPDLQVRLDATKPTSLRFYGKHRERFLETKKKVNKAIVFFDFINTQLKSNKKIRLSQYYSYIRELNNEIKNKLVLAYIEKHIQSIDTYRDDIIAAFNQIGTNEVCLYIKGQTNPASSIDFFIAYAKSTKQPDITKALVENLCKSGDFTSVKAILETCDDKESLMLSAIKQITLQENKEATSWLYDQLIENNPSIFNDKPELIFTLIDTFQRQDNNPYIERILSVLTPKQLNQEDPKTGKTLLTYFAEQLNYPIINKLINMESVENYKLDHSQCNILHYLARNYTPPRCPKEKDIFKKLVCDLNDDFFNIENKHVILSLLNYFIENEMIKMINHIIFKSTRDDALHTEVLGDTITTLIRIPEKKSLALLFFKHETMSNKVVHDYCPPKPLCCESFFHSLIRYGMQDIDQYIELCDALDVNWNHLSPLKETTGTAADFAIENNSFEIVPRLIQRMTFNNVQFHSILINAMLYDANKIALSVIDIIRAKDHLNWQAKNHEEVTLIEALFYNYDTAVLNEVINSLKASELKELLDNSNIISTALKESNISALETAARKLDGYDDILNYSNILKFLDVEEEFEPKLPSIKFILEHCKIKQFINTSKTNPPLWQAVIDCNQPNFAIVLLKKLFSDAQTSEELIIQIQALTTISQQFKKFILHCAKDSNHVEFISQLLVHLPDTTFNLIMENSELFNTVLINLIETNLLSIVDILLNKFSGAFPKISCKLFSVCISSGNTVLLNMMLDKMEPATLDDFAIEPLFIFAKKEGLDNLVIRALKKMTVDQIKNLAPEKQKIALTSALKNNQYALVNTLSKHATTLLSEDDTLKAKVNQSQLKYHSGKLIFNTMQRYKNDISATEEVQNCVTPATK